MNTHGAHYHNYFNNGAFSLFSFLPSEIVQLECEWVPVFQLAKKGWVTNYGRVDTKLGRKRKNMLAEFVIEKIERDRHNGTNSNNSLPGKYNQTEIDVIFSPIFSRIRIENLVRFLRS